MDDNDVIIPLGGKVDISETDWTEIESIRHSGVHPARVVNRAHALWCMGRDVPADRIQSVLGMSRSALRRLRTTYQRGGLSAALFDAARSGRPSKFDLDSAARLRTLAHSEPPPGQSRWTLSQLERAAVEVLGLSRVSRETVRRVLRHPA